MQVPRLDVPNKGARIWQCEAQKAFVQASTLTIVGDVYSLFQTKRHDSGGATPTLLEQLYRYGGASSNVTFSTTNINAPVKAVTNEAFPGIHCKWGEPSCHVSGTSGTHVFFRGDFIEPETRKLEFYGRYWDLRQPILTCKYCRLPLADIAAENEMGGNETGGHGKSRISLPAAYVAAGITKLLPANVILWRPVCMHRLSAHSPIANVSSAADFAQSPGLRDRAAKYLKSEIKLLEHSRQLVAFNVAAGVATSVVSLATMTWEPKKAVMQLAAFLPKLGVGAQLRGPGTAPLFTPEKDDKFKADFGSRHPPESAGFRLDRAACLFDGAEFSALAPTDMARLVEVSAYLHSVS
jgi:hypothetical protein